jgi:hypothetical protein
LKEIAGLNDSALGQLDRVQSGRAIQARQKQAIIGAEMYFDNFSRSKELVARQEISVVQKFYTEPRIIRIRSGQGGQPQETVINRMEAAGSIVNNISMGSYDVAIDQAPISATFLQGQFQEALELLEKGIPIPPDILIELSSMPNKESVKKRIDEQRLLEDNARRLEALGLAGQVGLPPGAPVPPVVVDGGPPVVTAPAGMAPQTLPSAPLPLPAPGGMPAGTSLPPATGEGQLAPLPPLERLGAI